MAIAAASEGLQGVRAAAAVALVTPAEDSLFTELVRRHRHELRVHAYRMLGSYEDSEDLAQETFLRAWSKRHTFRGDASFRSWLYRIATNACLSALETRTRRGETLFAPTGQETERPPEVEESDRSPEAEVESKEAVELAVLAAMRHLPARQRAVFFLRAVLGRSAIDTAELLHTSVASVNSALQRARATLRERLGEHRIEWGPGHEPSADERRLLERYVEAAELADVRALIE
jgi:RNA polymerase sigma-70 factor (ECF subfamily)